MRVSQFVRSFVPVTSAPNQPVERVSPVPRPEVGLRWGDQAQFYLADPNDPANNRNGDSRGGIRIIRLAEKVFHTVEIVDFGEVQRVARAGEIRDPNDVQHLVPLDETRSWMIPNGSYTIPDKTRLREAYRQVNVTYVFDMQTHNYQIDFDIGPEEVTRGP